MVKFLIVPIDQIRQPYVEPNHYRIQGDAVWFNVEVGVETVIDSEDLERVRTRRWVAYQGENSRDRSRWYVTGWAPGLPPTSLHRLILRAPKGVYVDHVNHDTLDNRKTNLRLVTHQENDMNRDGAYGTSKSGIRGVSEHRTNRGRLMYVFRCHGEGCRVAVYFPHTEHGLEQATAYGEAHYAGLEPPAWTLERPPVIVPNRKPAKLSDDHVREIRRSAAQGTTYQALADAFGVSISLVSNIVNHKARKYVTD